MIKSPGFEITCSFSNRAVYVELACVAQAAIIYAEGEAEAATLISEAVKVGGNGMIEVKRIDVSVMLPLQLSTSGLQVSSFAMLSGLPPGT